MFYKRNPKWLGLSRKPTRPLGPEVQGLPQRKEEEGKEETRRAD